MWNNMDRKIVYRNDGAKVSTLKWFFAVLLAGVLWLIAVYTDEYLRPYKIVGRK